MKRVKHAVNDVAQSSPSLPCTAMHHATHTRNPRWVLAFFVPDARRSGSRDALNTR
jgi:hypothetical protein